MQVPLLDSHETCKSFASIMWSTALVHVLILPCLLKMRARDCFLLPSLTSVFLVHRQSAKLRRCSSPSLISSISAELSYKCFQCHSWRSSLFGHRRPAVLRFTFLPYHLLDFVPILGWRHGWCAMAVAEMANWGSWHVWQVRHLTFWLQY